MPFGLDIKSLIVGFLLAWFAVPFILSHLGGSKAKVAV